MSADTCSSLPELEDARSGLTQKMYEPYYGFAEKPFSLTSDPKYLYRSGSHASALELLQYAIDRREGFVVITGDIGTGKTTLCRALLERTDEKTFTALLLNPFLSEEDLFRTILQDLGVVSKGERRVGRQPSKQDQILIRKERSLSEEERAKLRSYPLHGQAMLKNVPFLAAASEIAVAAHERYDGSGFLRGLFKGRSDSHRRSDYRCG
jgi:hypothetical protein